MEIILDYGSFTLKHNENEVFKLEGEVTRISYNISLAICDIPLFHFDPIRASFTMLALGGGTILHDVVTNQAFISTIAFVSIAAAAGIGTSIPCIRAIAARYSTQGSNPENRVTIV